MSVSYPLPGTKFYRAVADQLGAKRNWVDSSDLDMMYRGPFSTAFYRKLHEVLHAEFRMRRSWRAFRAAPTRPAQLARAATARGEAPAATASARAPGAQTAPRTRGAAALHERGGSVASVTPSRRRSLNALNAGFGVRS